MKLLAAGILVFYAALVTLIGYGFIHAVVRYAQ